VSSLERYWAKTVGGETRTRQTELKCVREHKKKVSLRVT
jgi:hypothetical protein